MLLGAVQGMTGNREVAAGMVLVRNEQAESLWGPGEQEEQSGEIKEANSTQPGDRWQTVSKAEAGVRMHLSCCLGQLNRRRCYALRLSTGGYVHTHTTARSL